jgi:hypothetical protein
MLEGARQLFLGSIMRDMGEGSITRLPLSRFECKFEVPRNETLDNIILCNIF